MFRGGEEEVGGGGGARLVELMAIRLQRQQEAQHPRGFSGQDVSPHGRDGKGHASCATRCEDKTTHGAFGIANCSASLPTTDDADFKCRSSFLMALASIDQI